MMGAELMNTAVERLCDWKAAGYDRTVRDAKDIAAAAVFLCALACAVIGLLFFVPALPQILAGLRSHPALILFLILSAPCAIWFIFDLKEKINGNYKNRHCFYGWPPQCGQVYADKQAGRPQGRHRIQ